MLHEDTKRIIEGMLNEIDPISENTHMFYAIRELINDFNSSASKLIEGGDDKTKSDIYYNMSRLYGEVYNDYNKSLEFLNKSLEYDTCVNQLETGSIYRAKCKCLYKMADIFNAKKCMEKAIRLGIPESEFGLGYELLYQDYPE